MIDIIISVPLRIRKQRRLVEGRSNVSTQFSTLFTHSLWYREFSVTGYSLHVQHTRNSACIAAYNAQLEPLESVDGVDGDADIYSGDYFADFDLEWLEEEPAEGL
jgi:hypothetical protein